MALPTFKSRNVLLLPDCALPVLAPTRMQYQLAWKCNKNMNTKKKKTIFLALIIIGILGMAGSAWATTLHVGSDQTYATIVGAVTVAAN